MTRKVLPERISGERGVNEINKNGNRRTSGHAGFICLGFAAERDALTVRLVSGFTPGGPCLVLHRDRPGARGRYSGAESEGDGQVGSAANVESLCPGDGQEPGQVGEERG